MILFCLRSLAALLLVGALLYASYTTACLLLRREPVLVRWAGALVILLFGATTIFHLLMVVHRFQIIQALVVTLLWAGALLRAEPRRLCRRFAALDLRFLRRVFRPAPLFARAHLVFFAFFAVLIAARQVVGLPLGWDTLVYHATKAAFWVQTGHLGSMYGPGQWGQYGLYPGGSEVFQAWAMMLFGSDLLVCLVDVFMWLGLGVGIWILCRRLGAVEPYASTAAVFVLAIPTYLKLVGAGYVEITRDFCGVLGLLLAVRFIRVPRGPTLLLAGAALSLYAATKHPSMPTAAVLMAIVLLRSLPWAWRERSRWAWVGACVLTSCIAIGPWLVVSMIHTGYPLSPLPMKVFGVTLGANADVERFMKHAINPKALVWANEWPYLKGIFPKPGHTVEAIGALSLVGIALLPVGLVACLRRAWSSGLLTLVAVVVLLWSFFSPSFSQARFIWPISSARHFMTFISVAAAVAVTWCRTQSLSSQLYRILLLVVLGFHLIFYCMLNWRAEELLPVLIVIVSATLAVCALRKIPKAVLRVAVGTVLALSALTVLNSWKTSNRYEIVGRNEVLHGIAKYWVEAAKHADGPVPKRLALTSGPALPCVWWTYYFFGRQFQNELSYVSVLPEGGNPSFCPGGEWKPRASYAAWLKRLKEKRIEYVMGFGPVSIEVGWMEAHREQFAKIDGNGRTWGLYQVR